VPPNGYGWWYIDGLSDDGRSGIVMIGFVGSVFSPYYYAERRKRPSVDPLDFAAFNVAVYTHRRRLWAFTERPRSAVTRSPDRLSIGGSAMEMTNDGLIVDLHEHTVVKGAAIKGRVRLSPAVLLDRCVDLTPSGDHQWCPIAPVARIEVSLEAPSLRFNGAGYADANFGQEPLEAAFDRWTWSRHATDRDGFIFYDGIHRDGNAFSKAFRCPPSGGMEPVDSPPMIPLRRTLPWGCPREVRSDDGARVVKTLESSPFYSRSIVESRLGGARALGVQETLRLDRFTTPLMQKMLPFRIDRRSR
jgi:carotenoid 1,2-hydratase